MKLTFLSAQEQLSKSFSKLKDEIEVEPYPLVKNLTSHEVEINSLQEFYNHLAGHSSQFHAMLKGNLIRQIVDESRAGLTDMKASTEFFVIDIDYLPDINSVDGFISQLPKEFHEVSYICQYSASYKINKTGLAAHLFFMLEEPEFPSALKEYTKWLNYEVFFDEIKLNKLGTALMWPLDLTINDNTRIIYIAPPLLVGLDDPIEDRVVLIKKAREYLSLDFTPVIKSDLNPKLEKLKNELRKHRGMPTLKTAPKHIGGINIQKKPGEALITGMKNARGFVYFNLNGGDSWAYYHPEDNYEYIFNFKGEPAYYTKELLPEYYAQCQQASQKTHVADGAIQEGTRIWLAFRDLATDMYYNGWYDTDVDNLELYKTGSKDKLHDFLIQRGEDKPDFIPDWRYEFLFSSDKLIDVESKWANKYCRSIYMRNPKDSADVPPLTKEIITHVTGNDTDVYNHFLNWLAAIIQQRRAMRTAWIFSGTQGTGKGVLFHKVLAPLIGENYASVKQLSQLEDQFNGYLEHTVFLYIDESEISAVPNVSKLIAYVKNLIVEPQISVRHMHQMAKMVTNNVNVIISSNKPDPMEIDQTDRRFNVGVFQNQKIHMTDKRLEALKEELYYFAGFLLKYEVNNEWLRLPLDNEPRRRLMYLTQNSIDDVAKSVLAGDFQYLLDIMPDQSVSSKPWEAGTRVQYKKTLQDILHRLDSTGSDSCGLTRDDLKIIFEVAVGKVPTGAIKLAKFLSHHGIDLKNIKVKDGENWKSARGITVKWQLDGIDKEKILSETKN